MPAWTKASYDRFLSLEFSLLSLEAQVTYGRAYMLAAKCHAGGALAVDGRSLPVESLTNPRIKHPKLLLAVDELCHMRDHAGEPWLYKWLDGTIEVPGWTADQSLGTAAAMRQKRYRENVTSDVTKRNGTSHKNVTSDAQNRNASDGQSVTGDASPLATPLDIKPTPGNNSLTSFGELSPYVGSVASPNGSAPTWVFELLSEGTTLVDRAFESFSIAERQRVAQLHCLLFGGCTKNERTNRTKATQVAVAIARMARSKNYADLKLRHYLKFALKVHEQRGGKPWYDPWFIESVVEFERA